MLDSARDLEVLNKAVRISKVPEKFRNAGEIEVLSGLISQFDIFQKKVSQEQLPEVLRAAASNVKYMKVPMGQFLYHKGIFQANFFSYYSYNHKYIINKENINLEKTLANYHF